MSAEFELTRDVYAHLVSSTEKACFCMTANKCQLRVRNDQDQEKIYPSRDSFFNMIDADKRYTQIGTFAGCSLPMSFHKVNGVFMGCTVVHYTTDSLEEADRRLNPEKYPETIVVHNPIKDDPNEPEDTERMSEV